MWAPACGPQCPAAPRCHAHGMGACTASWCCCCRCCLLMLLCVWEGGGILSHAAPANRRISLPSRLLEFIKPAVLPPCVCPVRWAKVWVTALEACLPVDSRAPWGCAPLRACRPPPLRTRRGDQVSRAVHLACLFLLSFVGRVGELFVTAVFPMLVPVSCAVRRDTTSRRCSTVPWLSSRVIVALSPATVPSPVCVWPCFPHQGAASRRMSVSKWTEGTTWRPSACDPPSPSWCC
jgi:hypothetical protein